MILRAVRLRPIYRTARHMTKRIYGYTRSGRPVTDDLIEDLAKEAEAGYDVDQVIARRGMRRRPDSIPVVL